MIPLTKIVTDLPFIPAARPCDTEVEESNAGFVNRESGKDVKSLLDEIAPGENSPIEFFDSLDMDNIDTMLKETHNDFPEVNIYEDIDEGENVLFPVEEDPDSSDESMRDANQLNSELRKVRQELEELRKMKQDFMLLTSHELKTPLTVLSGNFELFQGGKLGKLNEGQKKKFRDMARNLERIKEMTSSMYYLSKGQVHVDKRWGLCNLADILDEVVKDIRIVADRKNQEVKYSVPHDSFLIGSETELRNLFVKLLENAVRYTQEEGKISISVKKKGDELHIVVKDNGQGIPPELCERIFEEFYEINDVMKHKDGFGLGLSLARKIVRNHGGQMWVKSKPGAGSDFHVVLRKSAGIENTPEWKLQTCKHMCVV